MKQFTLGLAVGALVFFGLSAATAQQGNTWSKTITINPDDGSVISVTSPGWKQLSEEVAVRVYTDQRGTRRATLLVLDGDQWAPVALDGPEELMPPAIPVR